jgi:hypothetical protein
LKAKGISSLENQLSAAFVASEDSDEGDVLGINKQEKQKVKEEAYKPEPTPKPVPVEESIDTRFDFSQTEEESSTIGTQLSPKDIGKIINIYSAFSNMNTNIQKVVLKYLKIKAEDSIAEKVVIAVLNARKSDYTLLSSLTKLRNESGASRAFELIAMTADELIKLDDLVSSFNRDYKQTCSVDNDKIKFCKNLEIGISTLNPNATQYLQPVTELLKIAFS